MQALLAKTGHHPNQIRAIGSRQTIRHGTELVFTLRIGSGADLAVETGIDVICDFRAKDMALVRSGLHLWFRPSTRQYLAHRKDRA